MTGRAKLIAAGAFAAALSVGAAGPALADFSACESAFTATDPHLRINLWTLCITKSGLTGPERAGAFNNRALDYLHTGEEDKAFQDFTWSIESDPNWGTAYLNRGSLYAKRQDWAHALADFDKAAHLDPVPARRLALESEIKLLATCPDASIRDPAKAIQLAKAEIKRHDEAAAHDALAVAYEAAGQLDDAIREESQAVAQGDKQPERLAGYKARLEQLKAKAGTQSSG
jgi:tetratricopeptide (TPR) repeat protein